MKIPVSLKINDMSKTFEQNARKALTMAAGVKSHIDEVSKFGIRAESLDRLEEEAKKAIEMIREVDALRITVSEKLQKANGQLAEVKDMAMGIRQTIKNNYPPEKWASFGIMDKR